MFWSVTVVDILSDGQHLSGEKCTRAFDVLKLKMFIEVLGQGELKWWTSKSSATQMLFFSILPPEGLSLSL